MYGARTHTHTHAQTPISAKTHLCGHQDTLSPVLEAQLAGEKAEKFKVEKADASVPIITCDI